MSSIFDTFGGGATVTPAGDSYGNGFFSNILSSLETGASRIFSDVVPQFVDYKLNNKNPLFQPTFNPTNAPPNSQYNSAGQPTTQQTATKIFGFSTEAFAIVVIGIVGAILIIRN